MKGRGGCVRNIRHEHEFCQAQKAENTDPRTNYAVKYATARGHLRCSITLTRKVAYLKTRHPIKIGCTNSLRKLFLPASCLFEGMRGDKLYKQFRSCLCKVFSRRNSQIDLLCPPPVACYTRVSLLHCAVLHHIGPLSIDRYLCCQLEKNNNPDPRKERDVP